MKPRFPWKRILLAAILAIGTGSALAYTYTVMRGETLAVPSYTTIIPTDSPLRNTPGASADCGFSPNPCGQVGTIPEPGTWALMGLGFLMMLVIGRGRV